ncbi:hypothetical protein [Streptomyces wuyuanensis]|uniref:hypothetical protein n=1 Tax=Streptomyces wuyuanensis TaxID=1196353 RepID=UPI003719F272
MRAGRGTVVVVPPGCPRAFATGRGSPLGCSSSPPRRPPTSGVEEPIGVVDRVGPPDHQAITRHRARHGIERLTPLRHAA